MVEAVTEPAPAKINPFLRVLGRRDDGYHDIETLIVPVTLADGVQAVLADDLLLTVVGERATEVPTGDDNLVLAAARALQKRVSETRGARLLLSKRIPVTAGVGGGSADAAATLRGLNRLWGCDLDAAALIQIAAEVGSDVPALVPGGPVMAEGRGELVKPVEIPKTWWVIVIEPIGVPSADAYAWWDQDGVTGPDVQELMGALASADLDGVGRLLMNDLEAPVRSRLPSVVEARRRLLDAGALGALMSGSGPTVAGLARDAMHAEELARAANGLAVASMDRAYHLG